MQKTFVVDPITKRKLANNGELKRYYVRDAHESVTIYEQDRIVLTIKGGLRFESRI